MSENHSQKQAFKLKWACLVLGDPPNACLLVSMEATRKGASKRTSHPNGPPMMLLPQGPSFSFKEGVLETNNMKLAVLACSPGFHTHTHSPSCSIAEWKNEVSRDQHA